ncbi:MAG: type I methionyl aminopeptidase, partial [Gammaproteobacteria bacterium]|nr:type I methionyl aminopeptidase [Gammaproteobacteria bacterium]
TLRAGDMVNVDVSAEKNGYFADTGGSFLIPPIDQKKQRLILATKLALKEAIGVARAGQRINMIGLAIQRVAQKKGYRIIKNLCSHGIGRSLHEEPKEIPGFYDPQDNRKLWEGAVITIEPFLSTRSEAVTEDTDGWTLIAEPGNLSAQFEHTMVITRGKPILLTQAA